MDKKEVKVETVKKSELSPTVLVSGGAGLLGSHLIEALILKGAYVTAIDNFSTGKKAYIKSLMENPKFKLVECDINNGIPDIIESVDYIFHIAGFDSHDFSDQTLSLDSLLTNTVGTKNLLDLAAKSNAKFLLVSSIDVYQGIISSSDLSHYFGKNDTEEKRYSHSEAKRTSEALVWEFYKKNNLNARIVRLPEVYGPRMNFDTGNDLARLLKQLLDHEDLTIFGEGLDKHYFIYISDAINGILKAMFNENTEGQIYSFVGGEPVATLELAYLIKSLSNQETRVIFKTSPGEFPKGGRITEKEKLGWIPKITLKEGLTKTLQWYGYELNAHYFKPLKFLAKEPKDNEIVGGITSIKETPPVQVKVAPQDTKLKEISKPGNPWKLPVLGVLLSILAAVVFFVVLPLTRMFFYTSTGQNQLIQAKKYSEELNLDKALEESNKAQASFILAKSQLNNLGFIFVITGQEKRLRDYAKLLKVSEYLSSAISNTAIGAKPLTSLWQTIKPESESKIDTKDLDKAILNFKSAVEDLDRAQAELKDINTGSLPKNVVSKLDELKKSVPTAQEMLITAQVFLEAAPKLLGVGGERRYLVLFQNPTEIRATGGFIGSYAVAEFKDGKVSQIVIDDIYNVDGILDLNNNQTPAYDPVKRLLKQNYLRIRDANWNANFPESSEQIMSLFRAANGVSFDGVIGIDTYLVKDLLKVTGPIFLTAYNEEITSDNMYERAQYHSEALYQEGSQQKRAFLTVLGSKLLESVFALQNEKVSSLTSGLMEDMEQKHLLVYIPNSEVTSLISQKGWDGRVNQTKGDYVYLVDSNLGSNKANYFVKQEAKYEIKNTYRDGSLEVNLSVTYTHTGTDSTWPGGPYTDYLRVFTPNESFLHKATSKLDGAVSEDDIKLGVTTEDKFAEKDVTKLVKIGSEAGRRTFETEFILQPKQKLTLSFNYTLPSTISIGKGDDVYSLYWQKQPGTDSMPITVLFGTPFGKQVESTSPEFTPESTNQIYTYQGNLLKDSKFIISIK